MKLGDIVSLVRGNTYKSSLLSETEGPILLGLGSIDRNGGYKNGAWKHYPGPSDTRIMLYPGDLYVSLKDLTQKCDLLGSVARVPKEVSEGRLTQDTVKLVFDEKATDSDRKYVYWSLRTPQYRAYCKGRGTGTTNMSLSRKDFLSWELPSKSAQNDLLITLFELIDAKVVINQRTNDYLIELAKTQFNKLASDKSRLFRLEDLVQLEDSKRAPLNSRERAERRGPYPYFGAAGVMDYIDDFIFEGPRVLVGEDGTVVTSDGHPVLQYVWGKFWVNNHAHVLKASEDYPLEAVYIALSISSATELVTGAVQPKINQRNLRNFILSMPDYKQLAFLSPIFESYICRAEENMRLSRLRDALLPKLMSSEIDIH